MVAEDSEIMDIIADGFLEEFGDYVLNAAAGVTSDVFFMRLVMRKQREMQGAATKIQVSWRGYRAIGSGADPSVAIQLKAAQSGIVQMQRDLKRTAAAKKIQRAFRERRARRRKSLKPQQAEAVAQGAHASNIVRSESTPRMSAFSWLSERLGIQERGFSTVSVTATAEQAIEEEQSIRHSVEEEIIQALEEGAMEHV